MGYKGARGQDTTVDEEDLRYVLSHFATGITVVTGRDDHGRARAITVNAFASLSLEPPLILYALGKSAFNFNVFATAKVFAVNILSADQEALSDRFAREAEDAFPDVPVIELATGSPILVDGLGALDCETQAIHEAGDHLIMIGLVRALSLPREAEPLVYFRSRYRRVTS
ncbi:MAG: flavin reductase family protein [Pseudomonadota bacterium]